MTRAMPWQHVPFTLFLGRAGCRSTVGSPAALVGQQAPGQRVEQDNCQHQGGFILSHLTDCITARDLAMQFDCKDCATSA